MGKGRAGRPARVIPVPPNPVICQDAQTQPIQGAEMKWAYLMVACIALSACGSMKEHFQTETVYLGRPSKGFDGAVKTQNVQCGPYSLVNLAPEGWEEKTLRSCVNDYVRAGYQRVPAPAAK